MATTAHPPPAGAEAAHPGAGAAARGDQEAAHALVPAPQPQPDSAEQPVFPAPIPRLPVELGVTVPVREFRVRQLLALSPGEVIETQWSHGDDLPLAAGEVQVAWGEFEVVETQLAVRVTRLL